MVIHLIIVTALILVILLQRSGQDGLSGLGGGSGGGSNALFNIRGKANVLSRATAFLAAGFLITSLFLAYLATHRSNSVIDKVAAESRTIEAGEQKAGDIQATDESPAVKEPVSEPVAPEVPLAR